MKKSYPLSFLCCFLVAIFILYLNRYSFVGDDLNFSRQAIANLSNDPTHINWLISRYFSWSSRIWIEFALISVVNHFNVWAFINAIMFSLLSVSIGSIFYFRDNPSYKIILSFTSIFLIACLPRDIFFNCIIWIAGSVNYLWPTAFAFVGFYTLFRIIKSKKTSTASIICYASFILSSFNEQIVVVNLIICGMLLFFSRRNNYQIKPIFITVALSFLIFIFIATCPGNKVRYYSEITSWFKDFGSLNIFERALFGLNLYADMLFSNKTLLPAAMAFTLSIICNKKLRGFPFLSCCILLCIFFLNNPPHIFQRIQFNLNDITSALSIVRVSFAILLSFFIIVPVLISLRFNTISIFILSMILGAIGSVSMLGFSPTVYASGSRIYFIPYLTLISTIVTAILHIITVNAKNCTDVTPQS